MLRMLLHLVFLGFAVLTPSCGFIYSIHKAPKTANRAASISLDQAENLDVRVVIRSLPWTLEVCELSEQLNQSVSALYGPLSCAPEVITLPGGSKKLADGRIKWHTGTAFLTFVDSAVAAAAALDLTGGIILEGCGTRLVYGGFMEAALPAASVASRQDTQAASPQQHVSSSTTTSAITKVRPPTPQTELARRRHHRLSRRRRELEALDATMAAVTLPESLGGSEATLDTCRVSLVVPILDWDSNALRFVDPCSASPGILSPSVPERQALGVGAMASPQTTTNRQLTTLQQQQQEQQQQQQQRHRQARSSRKAAIRMAAGTARGGRKREQVEAFACVLRAFALPKGSTVVDCGSGSGHLTLPLAALFPELQIVALDFKEGSVNRLAQRAAAAGLTNVFTVAGRIEDYQGPCAAVVALHACGSASDAALQLAIYSNAEFAVSPCCVGKLRLKNQGTAATPLVSATGSANDGATPVTASTATNSDLLSADGARATADPLLESVATTFPETSGLNPQSSWLRHQLPLGAFSFVAKAADDPAAFPGSSPSTVIDSSSSKALTQEKKTLQESMGSAGKDEVMVRAAWERCRRAKALVEIDRLMAAQERRGGALGTLYAVQGEHMSVYPKNDLLTSRAIVANDS